MRESQEYNLHATKLKPMKTDLSRDNERVMFIEKSTCLAISDVE